MEKNRIATRSMFLVFLVFLGLSYLIWSGNSMEDFQGYEEEAMSSTEAANFLQAVTTNLENGKAITINERDLNRFLKGKFQLEQSLTAKPWVTPTGIFVDLKEDQIRLCLDRSISGRIQHQSQIKLELRTEVTQRAESTSRDIILDYKSGQVGKLKLPRLFTPGFNGWYNTFAEVATDQLTTLQLNKCHYKVMENEIIISPPINRKL